jgi:MraZ protein
MLLGQYDYKVDSKGRLPLPPKFRPEFKEGLVLTRGLDNCIVVYRKAEFAKLAANFANKAITKSKERRYKRFIFGSAFDIEMDGQGRIALPPSLRSYAKIGDAVIIVGNNDLVELWSPEVWESEQKESEDQAWQINESFEE